MHVDTPAFTSKLCSHPCKEPPLGHSSGNSSSELGEKCSLQEGHGSLDHSFHGEGHRQRMTRAKGGPGFRGKSPGSEMLNPVTPDCELTESEDVLRRWNCFHMREESDEKSSPWRGKGYSL